MVLAFAGLFGLGTGACSMSMPLGSLFSEKSREVQIAEKGDAGDITGSLPLQSARVATADGGMNSADWSLATAALREALAKSEEGASVPWQNPTTGARGTVTPIASAYIQDGFACRDFLASRVGNGRESWFEGTACRVHRGQWDVRSSRPLQKS